MRSSDLLITFIKKKEGFSLKAYLCPSKKWTIGWGHTGGVKPGMVITELQAAQFLANDIAVAENAVNKYVKVPLTDGEFETLVSFVMNVGVGTPDTPGYNDGKGFRGSTLLTLLNLGAKDQVPKQLRRWVHDDKGRVLQGLVDRREEELAKFWNRGK
jgi:lysozyme